MSQPPTVEPYQHFPKYSSFSFVWLGLVFFCSKLIPEQPLIFLSIGTLLFAIPLGLSGGYTSAVGQIRTLSYFREGGRIHKFLVRRWLRALLWILFALGASLLMLVQMATYTALEWLAVGISIPVYWICHTKLYRKFVGELEKPFFAISWTITVARWLCPFFMLCIFVALLFIFGGVSTYERLTDALQAKRSMLPSHFQSQTVQVAFQISTFAEGFKSYVFSQSSVLNSSLPFVFSALGTYLVFVNVCSTLFCFAIPGHELRRVIAPLSEEPVPSPIPRFRIALASALFTFVVIFIYLPLVASIEAWTQSRPQVLRTLVAFEQRVEKIGDTLYAPGTIAKIEFAKAKALAKLNDSQIQVDSQLDLAFARMERNVDGYLDWYYSLTAEYTRLGKLLIGEVEGYMEKKLTEHLKKGEPFKLLSDSLSAAASAYKVTMTEYRASVNETLRANQLTESVKGLVIREVGSIEDILTFPSHFDAVTLAERTSGSAIGAAIGAAVTAKVVGKGMFKAAAKVVLKAAMSKGAGTVVGAGAGAAIGSIIPGAGTVIGGVVGGLIGGVSVDASLLKLEEAISREKFKKEIIDSIGQSRVELKAKLFSRP